MITIKQLTQRAEASMSHMRSGKCGKAPAQLSTFTAGQQK